MKKRIFIILITITFSCKDKVDSIIIKSEKDSSILYYKNNGVKDSIASIFFNFGLDEKRNGEFRKALINFQKADSIEPRNVTIVNSLGTISSDLKNSDKAYEYYYKAIEIDSTYPHTYLNLGFEYNTNKQREKAIEILKKGLSIEYNTERKGYFNYNIANALYKLGKYNESELFNNTALELVKEKEIRNEIYELRNAIESKKNN
tara:strand:- start:978 stop:1589 length:612 start_codon:yes stop_codon:yes gene_type:complete